MITGLVVDTHALVWYVADRGRLSAAALAAMDAAAAAGAPLIASAITLVELVYLVEKGRLPKEVLQRITDAANQPGNALSIAPLDASVAQTLPRVPRIDVPDLPDQVIAATSLCLDLPLVSCDRRIRASGVNVIW
ncbi:MAG: PIN domain-containing protein [Planctomycetes bacterium]|nr:PIN domain-containing protein [Planctomycetota bacterium]